MKEQCKFSKENLNALETGLIRDEENPHVKPTESSTRKQLKQCLKIVIYLELMLLVMWASYTLWQTYPVNTNPTDITNVQQIKTYSLLRQNWINEKNNNSSEKLYESEDILKDAENWSKEIAALSNETSNNDESEYFNKEITVVHTTENSDTEINEEHDLILPTTNDNEFTSQTTESSTAFKDYSTLNIMEDQSENTSEISVENSYQDVTVWHHNLPNHFTSEERSNDESKTDEMLEMFNNNMNETVQHTLENYLFFMLVLNSAMKTIESAKDVVESSNEKKADFEMYSEMFSDEYADDSPIASEHKPLTEVEKMQAIKLEGKLISLEDSYLYEDTVNSQSAPKHIVTMRQVETFIVSDEDTKSGYSGPISEDDKSENSDTETREEHDLILPTANDNKFASKAIESSTEDKDSITPNIIIEFQKRDENLKVIEGSALDPDTKEKAENFLRNLVSLLLMRANAAQIVEPSKDFVGSSNEEESDSEMYSASIDNKSADDSSLSSELKLTEMDNVEGISEDKLIPPENSYVHEDTVISQSALKDADETRQIKSFTYYDEYPQTQQSQDTFHTPIPIEDYFNKDTVLSTTLDKSKDDSRGSSQTSASLVDVNSPNYFLGSKTSFLKSRIRKPNKFMDIMNSEEFDSDEGYLRRLEKRSDNSATTTNRDSTRSYMENKEERSDDHLLPQFLKKKIQNDIGDYPNIFSVMLPV